MLYQQQRGSVEFSGARFAPPTAPTYYSQYATERAQPPPQPQLQRFNLRLPPAAAAGPPPLSVASGGEGFHTAFQAPSAPLPSQWGQGGTFRASGPPPPAAPARPASGATPHPRHGSMFDAPPAMAGSERLQFAHLAPSSSSWQPPLPTHGHGSSPASSPPLPPPPPHRDASSWEYLRSGAAPATTPPPLPPRLPPGPAPSPPSSSPSQHPHLPFSHHAPSSSMFHAPARRDSLGSHGGGASAASGSTWGGLSTGGATARGSPSLPGSRSDSPVLGPCGPPPEPHHRYMLLTPTASAPLPPPVPPYSLLQQWGAAGGGGEHGGGDEAAAPSASTSPLLSAHSAAWAPGQASSSKKVRASTPGGGCGGRGFSLLHVLEQPAESLLMAQWQGADAYFSGGAAATPGDDAATVYSLDATSPGGSRGSYSSSVASSSARFLGLASPFVFPAPAAAAAASLAATPCSNNSGSAEPSPDSRAPSLHAPSGEESSPRGGGPAPGVHSVPTSVFTTGSGQEIMFLYTTVNARLAPVHPL